MLYIRRYKRYDGLVLYGGVHFLRNNSNGGKVTFHRIWNIKKSENITETRQLFTKKENIKERWSDVVGMRRLPKRHASVIYTRKREKKKRITL